MAKEDYKITKDQGFRMTLSGITSSLAVLATLWVFAEPILVKSVSVAMAGDITMAVNEQVEPLNKAFTVILTRDINSIRKEIAALRFRQRTNQNWTVEDASYLEDLLIELEALKSAREELESETR